MAPIHEGCASGANKSLVIMISLLSDLIANYALGPDSYQASVLAELRERSTKDEQVFCFQLGDMLAASIAV